MLAELCCCTETLLMEIRDNKFKRRDIAKTYFLAMTSTEKTDWKKVNTAIIERWSISGLKYIKRLAHNMLKPYL